MDTYMHKTMASVASQEFMPREARLKFLKKMIILGPKTAILEPPGPPWIRPWNLSSTLQTK